MIKIFTLTDYKGFFGSKYCANPYRSGFDKRLLSEYFKNEGFELVYINFSEIDFRKNLRNNIYIYTSSEDLNLYYKDFIEDILLGIHLKGGILIPDFVYFRAHHNKVFSEILRNIIELDDIKNLKSYFFGTLEELNYRKNDINYPQVIKSSIGAMSKGVSLIRNEKELKIKCGKFSKTKYILYDVRDYLRSIKRKGYLRDSKNRKKFILQEFVPGMKYDWKILIYGNKYYVLKRIVRNNDFRASGSGKLIYDTDFPKEILIFSNKIYDSLNVPNLSLDVAFDGKNCYLFEYQAIYFGTYTLEYSSFYFIKENNQWTLKEEKSILEKEYSKSISDFIKKQYSHILKMRINNL